MTEGDRFEYSYKCGCSIVWTKEEKLQLIKVCSMHEIIRVPAGE